MSDKTIGFIGLGLIGGSIAKALRRVHPEYRLIAYNRSRSSLVEAMSDGTINQATDVIDASFAECDFIFLCMPVSVNIQCLKKLKDLVPDTCVITDVGSVKSTIHEAVRELGMEARFIGGHPMAGSEKTGYTSATDRLLENAYYIITPTALSNPDKVAEMRQLVTDTGAVPIVLNCEEHDYATAAISHLPHVIAYTLVNLVRTSDSREGLMRQLAAGGFKDITRIASSSPVMWEQICMSALQHQETEWTLPLAALTWWMPSVRPSKTKMWYHRTAWILPTVPQKSLKHCSLETERYMKSIRTSRETAWRQSYGYL